MFQMPQACLDFFLHPPLLVHCVLDGHEPVPELASHPLVLCAQAVEVLPQEGRLSISEFRNNIVAPAAHAFLDTLQLHQPVAQGGALSQQFLVLLVE